MTSLLKMTWVETKLFLREPVTVLFTFALPLMVLYVLGGVFGNEGDTGGNGGFVVYGGYGPTNWYTPAYVGLAIAGVAMIGVPAHIAEYRERGVLRRLRASSVSRTGFLSAQLIVSFFIAAIGSVLLLAVAFPSTEVDTPVSAGLFLIAFVLGAVCFSAFGILVGTVLPTARAAQSAGLLLWFLFMFVSGAGPPPEVLPESLAAIGEYAPLTPVIKMLQEPWLSGEWAVGPSVAVLAIGVVSAGAAYFLFKWE
ncbi:MAG: ABC transporter permease [Acidimicrobiia bacterium]|nr:ABC transporter permease [Acidimicrobiia bacterium]MDH3396675.1 ABC transporter permease [Acidimicrobiia bacterium]MDH5616191.1 ABC transporter permease [Acidimicrobiia bacterium]